MSYKNEDVKKLEENTNCFKKFCRLYPDFFQGISSLPSSGWLYEPREEFEPFITIEFMIRSCPEHMSEAEEIVKKFEELV